MPTDLQQILRLLAKSPQPQLLADYLIAKQGVAVAMLGLVWTRLSALQVVATAMFAGAVWLFARASHLQISYGELAVTAGATLTFVFTAAASGFLVTAAWPRDTIDPYAFGDLTRSITARAEQLKTEISDEIERERLLSEYQQVVLLMNLADVAETLQKTNGPRLRALRRASQLILSGGITFLLSAGFVLFG